MGQTKTRSFADVEGERFESIERLVIAPDAGVFEPSQGLTAGSNIAAGQVIGHLSRGADRIPVVSPFAGSAAETLAWPGERLTAYQPVMWLSPTAGTP